MKSELKSRREFFKEAAKISLPVFGMALFASTPFFSACTKEPDPSECGTCTGSCSSSCSESCVGSSTGSSCSSCGSNCSTECSTSCGNECTNDCSSNCSNSSNNSTNETISEASGSIDGHEYVDLGLSVKWARCNINAAKPQNTGLYGRSIHFIQLSNEERLTYLISSNLYFTTSQKKDLGGIPEFDISTEKWGNNWRTPSASEWQELINNCTIEAYELENDWGIKVTSQRNGKSLFIPLPGNYYEGNWSNIGRWGGYSSSTLKLHYTHNPQSVDDTRIIRKSDTNEIKIYICHDNNLIRAVTTGSGGGPTNCNGNCTNTATNNSCSNCQIGCISACTQQCSSDCTTGCRKNCKGFCINGCSDYCKGTCHHSCGGTCSYVSKGSSCTSGTCATACVNYCYQTCQMACSESCMSCCITSSK